MTSLSGRICLVGHPFAPIGMGEHVRCTYRSLRSVAIKPSVVDIYGLSSPEAGQLAEFSAVRAEGPSEVNVFHINADEVKQALAHLEYHRPWTGRRAIYPAWELARYPQDWARQVDEFDEIWAPSRFVMDALRPGCKRPVVHMPLACEVVLSSFLSRRYFGIAEDDYVFLFFFDMRSYPQRKNPQAVVRAFRELLQRRPYSKARLVMKVNGADLAPKLMQDFADSFADLSHAVDLITRVMSDNETKNLVRCCDAFVSLHRSEGYGRGMAEAMFLGKPVIATGYSGNMDFMTPETAFLLPFKLVPVREGEYPHWQDQVWADPDIGAAAHHMAQLVDDPQAGRRMGARASRHIRINFGYRAAGLRYRKRLEEISEHV